MDEPISARRNLALFVDTETTGLPLWSEPSEDPRQPHIVQLGALLVDLDERVVVDGLDVIVAPNGWTIPDEVSLIHGITHDYALAHGIPEADALTMLLALAERASLRVGHGEPFDQRIVRIALKRYRDDEAAEAWKAMPAACTMRASTSICCLPPTEKMVKARRGGQFKSPQLIEAYKHFFGEGFEGAHGALIDAARCMDVFFALPDLDAIAREPAVA